MSHRRRLVSGNRQPAARQGEDPIPPQVCPLSTGSLKRRAAIGSGRQTTGHHRRTALAGQLVDAVLDDQHESEFISRMAHGARVRTGPTTPPAPDALTATREADAIARITAGGADVFEAMRAVAAEWLAEAAE